MKKSQSDENLREENNGNLPDITQMTKQQLQALYDKYGTNQLARRIGISRDCCSRRIKAAGIRLRRRGQGVRGHCQVVERIYCQRAKKNCVMHGDPSECAVCEYVARMS